MSERIRGVIERVTYHNPENGFSVLRVRVPKKNDLVTVVGKTTSVTAGEEIQATGQWKVDREHGQQFAADEIRISHPTSVEGIERYLGSGALRSVGPRLAARIVRAFGPRTLEILDRAPDFLLQIRGIGPERLKRIRQSWQQQREVRRIMLFLSEHAVPAGLALRIYRTYGQDAIDRLRSNPYQLADDIRGIGFKTADQLAARLGMDRQSPQRADAAVRYALQELAGQGHCGFPEAGVVETTTELAEIEPHLVEQAIQRVVAEGLVVREAVEDQAFLYLAALDWAERGLAESVKRIATAGPHPLPSINLPKALEWVEQRLTIELAPGQREAIRSVCQNKLTVITGGPGVGKTTIVRSILEIFSAKGLETVLAAPTGRAAKRLAETTQHEAKTIHRLLEFDPATGEFRHDADHPLDGDLFVLDETSMVDAVLGYQFLRAVPHGACVVFVGDVDQLPSVGPGAVLADLINSGTIPVARLTEIFRQASSSRIVLTAYAVNEGTMPELRTPGELSDFYFVESNDPPAICDLLVRLVQERIPSRFGFDRSSQIQVLSPMNRSVLGTRNLNQVLQQAINPPGDQAEVEYYGSTFRVGDRVIQNINNYDRDVFNGDQGIIRSIHRIDQELTVEFEGRGVVYEFSDLEELTLAYALSIHKSQGSEFPCVVIPLHTQHFPMLRRNLLYTAITRGRQLVVIVGSRRALSLAIRRVDTNERHTALCRRLQEIFARGATDGS